MYYTKATACKALQRQQRLFCAMVQKVAAIKDLHRRAERARLVAHIALRQITNVFSSATLEEPFLALASEVKAPMASDYELGSILHVMTSAFSVGGHTRCVERWVYLLDGFKHSVVILDPKEPVPPLLEANVRQRGGEVISFPKDKPMLQRALMLRTFASRFHYVVLHVHMHDPMPLIAFGTESFKRPVVYFNHADHGFWLGVAIADCVADLHHVGWRITMEHRGAVRANVLGIPPDNRKLNFPPSAEARHALGIPKAGKLLFASGTHTKLNAFEEPNFATIVNDLLSSTPEAIFCVVGVDSMRSFWKELKVRWGDRLWLRGAVSYDPDYLRYVAAADLVIDSYPVGGGTALIDAVCAGKPVLSLNVDMQSDYVTQSLAACPTYETLLTKARRILCEPAYAEMVYQDILKHYNETLGLEAWRTRAIALLQSLPNHHEVHPLKKDSPSAEIHPVSLKAFLWFPPPTTLKSVVLRRCFSVYLFRKKLFFRVGSGFLCLGGEALYRWAQRLLKVRL